MIGDNATTKTALCDPMPDTLRDGNVGKNPPYTSSACVRAVAVPPEI